MVKTRSGSPIKLTVQFTNILRTQEARPGTQDRSRLLAAQPALSHQQILHEGDQQMHRGHRQSKFVHFHCTGLNFWILANETGTRITTPKSIHHSKQRTHPLDHVTHGTTGLPGKLPKTNGTSTSGITEHPHLHRRCADPHGHSRKAPGGSGTSTNEVASAPPKNQPGQMPLQQQTNGT